jgi:hypothetical protein
MAFRAGRTAQGETFLPAATTQQRLIRAGLGQPGDTMLQAPLRFLANAARDAGVDALVINPGTVPFGHLAGPELSIFADGGVPDGAAPDHLAAARPEALGAVEFIDENTFPAGLVGAATVAVRMERQVRGAALVCRSVAGGRVFEILAVGDGVADGRALNDRLAARLTRFIGPEDYFGVEFVAVGDPRLSDPDRAVPLIQD